MRALQGTTLKRDALLLAMVLALSLVAWIALRAASSPAAYACVEVGGTLYARLPLREDVQYMVQTDAGYNLLEINAGSVRVLEADCPDKRCVRQGAMAYMGAVVACVPHGLLITLEGAAGGVDAVSQ